MKIKIDSIVPQFDGIHYIVTLNKPYSEKTWFKTFPPVKKCYGVYGTDKWFDQDLNPLPPKLNHYVANYVVISRLNIINDLESHVLPNYVDKISIAS